MKIITKRLKVIQMTEEEIRKFHETMERAQLGQTVKYAEEQLSDGSFLGVEVVEAVKEPFFHDRPPRSRPIV